MKIEKTCIRCRETYIWHTYIPWMCKICKNEYKLELLRKKELSLQKKIIRTRRNKIKYREKHKERLREYNSKYIKDRRNNDYEFYLKHLISVHKRRAVIVNWDVTSEQLQKKIIEQDMKCAYCKRDLLKVKKHLDHITPISIWWTHEIWNLHWTCSNCNLSKNNKSHKKFLEIIADKGLL